MVYKKDLDLQVRWAKLMTAIEHMTSKRPKDLNAVLFLIGIQELGKGKQVFSKEEKQDLMHIAICKILSYSGFYELEGLDEDGWPHWKPKTTMPKLDIIEQEKLLKMHVLEYFSKELQLDITL